MQYVNNTGWLPSPDSEKDWSLDLLSIPIKMGILPDVASIEAFIPRIDNQLDKPWCVAFNTVNPIEFAMRIRGIKIPEKGFSKAFMYAMCKKYDGVPNQDGTFIRTALDVATKYGLCPDELCPTAYWMTQNKLPVITNEMLNAASKYKIKAFFRLQDANGYTDINQIKQSIANQQFVIIGSWVEQDNWLDGDDLVLKPKGTILGGHCTSLFDYNNNMIRKDYIGFLGDANSWGESWGDRGKCHIAYDYVDWKTIDTKQPALQEAWTFTIEGEIKMNELKMPIPMQVLQTAVGGSTVLPFRAIYEALGGKVNWFVNNEGKTVATAEVELKDRKVMVETIEGESVLKIYEI